MSTQGLIFHLSQLYNCIFTFILPELFLLKMVVCFSSVSLQYFNKNE